MLRSIQVQAGAKLGNTPGQAAIMRGTDRDWPVILTASPAGQQCSTEVLRHGVSDTSIPA